MVLQLATNASLTSFRVSLKFVSCNSADNLITLVTFEQQ